MSADHRSQRLAAALFLGLSVPAAAAVALAGGAIALAPMLLLVVPILLLGRAPGVETLERARAGIAKPKHRDAGSFRPADQRQAGDLATYIGVVLAGRLAERGPPAAALSS
jgi:hypothetical protein